MYRHFPEQDKRQGYFDVGSGGSRWVFWDQMFSLRHCNFLPVKLVITLAGKIVRQLCIDFVVTTQPGGATRCVGDFLNMFQG